MKKSRKNRKNHEKCEKWPKMPKMAKNPKNTKNGKKKILRAQKVGQRCYKGWVLERQKWVNLPLMYTRGGSWGGSIFAIFSIFSDFFDFFEIFRNFSIFFSKIFSFFLFFSPRPKNTKLSPNTRRVLMLCYNSTWELRVASTRRPKMDVHHSLIEGCSLRIYCSRLTLSRRRIIRTRTHHLSIFLFHFYCFL